QVAAAGKAETFERVVEEAAGEVAGKRPSRAVRAPKARRQTDDQEPRAARTERGDRRVEPPRLAAAPIPAERFEARAERAGPPRLAGRVGTAPFSLRSRRHRGARRRPPAAAPPDAAGIAACGAHAARALRAPRARPGRGRSWAAARRCRGRRRLGGATRPRPSAAASRWWRPRSRARAPAAPRNRLDQRAKVAVAREQHHVIDRACDLHGIDRELDVHVALDLAPAGLIDEFFGRLGDDAIAVVVEPVDQRSD